MKQPLAQSHDPVERPIINILLIEDNDGDAFLIQEMLEKVTSEAFSIFHAPTLETGEPEYKMRNFNVLLLDLSLPGLSGMEAVEKVRGDLPSIPIIVMTGMDDEKKALDVIKRGAQDYIVKGQYANNILPRAIRYAIERKQFENRVIELMHFDRITGLINREVFLDRLENTIAYVDRNNIPFAIAMLSLRRFKEVTATLGHETGNALLKAVAMRLKESLLKEEALARLEGDEFIFLVVGHHAKPQNLALFCQTIIDAIERPFDGEEQPIHIGCSIGVATYPACGKNKTELTKHADVALHRAKQNPKNGFQFYTQTLNEELNGRIRLEKELQTAITQRQLITWYQPIIDLKNNSICGVETLVRWNHPERGIMPPSTFIPLAEKSELILAISEYVMQEACKDFLSWKHLIPTPVYVAINLSARDFQKKEFIQRLDNAMAATNISSKDVALEVTESLLMEDPKQAIATLKACRQIGASIFVDDFGTGYSSLSYLSALPLDVLKIDRSFVKDITTNGHNLLIATATINLAHALGLKVVAEGIETSEQKEALTILGCDKAQGYYFAKPMPLESLVEWLQKFQESTIHKHE